MEKNQNKNQPSLIKRIIKYLSSSDYRAWIRFKKKHYDPYAEKIQYAIVCLQTNTQPSKKALKWIDSEDECLTVVEFSSQVLKASENKLREMQDVADDLVYKHPRLSRSITALQLRFEGRIEKLKSKIATAEQNTQNAQV